MFLLSFYHVKKSRENFYAKLKSYLKKIANKNVIFFIKYKIIIHIRYLSLTVILLINFRNCYVFLQIVPFK